VKTDGFLKTYMLLNYEADRTFLLSPIKVNMCDYEYIIIMAESERCAK